MQFMQPYAVLDGEGDAYIESESVQPRDARYTGHGRSIAIRIPKEREITGRLFVVNTDGRGLAPIRFKVPSSPAQPEAKQKYHEVRAAYYHTLLNQNLPGAAWFRHQEQQSLNELPGKTNRLTPDRTRFRMQRPSELVESYDLFSGGRAVSENLQLDRILNATASGPAMVDLTNLPGITIQEMDWKVLVKDLKPQTDPLASCIPADQHALFFPSFQAMTVLMDEADFHGTPVLQLLEPRAEDSRTRQRCQKQLCLDLTELSRLIGPYMITSVAFTGSDPYLRTGSDVGVAYECKNPDILKAFVVSKYAATLKAGPGVKEVKGGLDGVAYSGVNSPDRAVSSYVASVKNIVFVSNSLFQLGQMIKTAQGKIPSLVSLDEYIFFRNRYKCADPEETAFLVLTDAAIRRWCGPRWRIMSARRTQAAAVMSELQATNLDAFVKGNAQPGPLKTELNLPGASELQLTREGVQSSVYGTLDFLTPIAEIPLSKVTQAEADAYTQWRNRYQGNWRQFFDPIAVRFSVRASQMSADLTVMPLIAGTDYRDLIEATRGMKIAAGAGDPHTNAILHLILAMNAESRPVTQLGVNIGPFSSSPLKANPLGWLGQSVAVYFDDDPFWNEMRKSTNAPSILQRGFFRLPIGLWCEVKNPLGLGAFLTTLRGMSDTSAPGIMMWENLEYHGQVYVKVSSTRRSSNPQNEPGNPLDNLAVYYQVTPEFLLVTLSEPLLKRAVDRQAERAKLKSEGGKPAPIPRLWLGESFCLQGNKLCLEMIQALTHDEMSGTLQRLSWNNLPILNEWRRLYPDRDPVQLHERCWQTKLVCPAGGTYVWNDKWQTMESTVCGHPGEPKPVSAERFILPNVTAANLGVTFESLGLRAKAVLERESPAR
jgi:hypothetical protein